MGKFSVLRVDLNRLGIESWAGSFTQPKTIAVAPWTRETPGQNDCPAKQHCHGDDEDWLLWHGPYFPK